MGVFDQFRLNGRRALITGGSRGLGRVMAQALVDAGAELVLVGREREALEQAKVELAAGGANVHYFVGDMGDPIDAQRVCNEAVKSHGTFDVLINNVGGRRISIPTEEITLAQWQTIVDLNLTSTFLACQIIGKTMLTQNRGSIINISSIAGLIVNKGIYGRTYETTKAAMISFTRTLAVDWASRGVRVNTIAPGGFLTDPNRKWFREKPELQNTFEGMIPMGRLGNPDEIGPLALFLASDASSYMTGATLVIDGGYTLW